MRKATPIYQIKQVRADGSIIEGVIWKLPEATKDRPHGLKYRLYYGLRDGTCMVRYDNETGKGDHRHRGKVEEPYKFVTMEMLLLDFIADVHKAGGLKNEGEKS